MLIVYLSRGRGLWYYGIGFYPWYSPVEHFFQILYWRVTYLLNSKMRQSQEMLLTITIEHRIEMPSDLNRPECWARISNINITGKILYLKLRGGGQDCSPTRWKTWFGSRTCEDDLGFIGLIWTKSRVKLLYFMLVRPFLQYCVQYWVWHILNGTVTNWRAYREGFPGWNVWKTFHTSNNQREGGCY